MKELSENEEEEKTLPKDKKQKTSMSNHNWTSPTDPDARISKKKHKPLQLNYAGQISVDTHSHVICGAMADFANKRDAMTLPALVDQVCENLQQEGIDVEDVLADTNYSSGDALRHLENKGIGGYIPCYGPYKNKREDFIYNKEEDCYVCSQGKKLPLKKIIDRKSNGKHKVYRSSSIDCKDCPLKTKCIGNMRNKQLMDTIDKPYYDKMYERVKTKKGRQMKKLRSSTVEPVLGTLLHFWGMMKVYTKGITLANKHVLLATTAYNIKKLLRFRVVNYAQTGIKRLEKVYKYKNNQFFDLFLTKITCFLLN